MPSEDEEDYMSDAFLAKCADVRPGLVSNEKARQYKSVKEHKRKNITAQLKPRKQIESENRNEGLAKTIGSENKGFALLQKMGYKPGMALGKKGTGRTEPIPVEIKVDRGGLGKAADMKRKQEQRNAMRAQMTQKRLKREENLKGDFMHRMSSKQKDRETERDLYRSQKVCEQLDSQKDIAEPCEIYFWPVNRLLKTDEESEEESEEEDEDTIEPSEKLIALTHYLRDTHLYCVWCGTSFNDENDLQENCPGNTSEDHG